MRKVLVAIAVLGILAVPASASAAGPTKAQFNALKAKVTVLQKQVNELEELTLNMGAFVILNECGDAIQWDFISAIGVALGAPALPRYDDGGACEASGIDRPRVALGIGQLRMPEKPSSSTAFVKALARYK
jgi:hypothetical protein